MVPTAWVPVNKNVHVWIYNNKQLCTSHIMGFIHVPRGGFFHMPIPYEYNSGPFVMNTYEEISQAIMDYSEGKNGFERAPGWRSEIGKSSLR